MRLNYYYTVEFDLILPLPDAAERGALIKLSADSSEREIMKKRWLDGKQNRNTSKKWRQREGAGHIRGWRGFDLMVPKCPPSSKTHFTKRFRTQPHSCSLSLYFSAHLLALHNHVSSTTSFLKKKMPENKSHQNRGLLKAKFTRDWRTFSTETLLSILAFL